MPREQARLESYWSLTAKVHFLPRLPANYRLDRGFILYLLTLGAQRMGRLHPKHCSVSGANVPLEEL